MKPTDITYKVWADKIKGYTTVNGGIALDQEIIWLIDKGVPLVEIHVSLETK